MKKAKEIIKNIVVKHGKTIASCAFVCVTAAANSPCIGPFYEPAEPQGLDSFKKFNK